MRDPGKIRYKEAPIYFSNIFISFLGLAYFSPLWCSLRFEINLPTASAKKLGDESWNQTRILTSSVILIQLRKLFLVISQKCTPILALIQDVNT